MDTNDHITLSDYYSLADAARQLRKSEKQTRRYVADGRLPGSRMIGRMLYIPRSSVEALQAKPVQLEDTMSRRVRLLEDKMAWQQEYLMRQMVERESKLTVEFEQKLDEMARQIQSLRAEIETIRTGPGIAPRVVESVKWDIPSRQRSVPSVKSNLPEGLIGWREFARHHGFTEDAQQSGIYRAIIDGRIPSVTQPPGEVWKVGRARVPYAFDEECRRQFCLYYADHPAFHQCDAPECPCQE